MTELDLHDGRMISEAKMISQIHDYISILMSGLEVHPENPIMLQQHEHWTAMAQKLTARFTRKYGRYPVTVVEDLR